MKHSPEPLPPGGFPVHPNWARAPSFEPTKYLLVASLGALCLLSIPPLPLVHDLMEDIQHILCILVSSVFSTGLISEEAFRTFSEAGEGVIEWTKPPFQRNRTIRAAIIECPELSEIAKWGFLDIWDTAGAVNTMHGRWGHGGKWGTGPRTLPSSPSHGRETNKQYTNDQIDKLKVITNYKSFEESKQGNLNYRVMEAFLNSDIQDRKKRRSPTNTGMEEER